MCIFNELIVSRPCKMKAVRKQIQNKRADLENKE